MRRYLTTGILVALAFIAIAALPAVSLAQSAGDDQYQDPIPGGGGTGGGGGSGGGSTGGGSTGGGSTGGGTSTPAPTQAAGTPSTTAAATPQEATPTRAGELPRTGFDVLLTVELGMAMLLTGLVTQRLLVLRDRR